MDDFMPPELKSVISRLTDEERLRLGKILSDRGTTSVKPARTTAITTTAATAPMTSSFKGKSNKSVKSKVSKTPKPPRSFSGMEDIFSEEQVRVWSEVRIRTWQHRRTNVEAFYYRFVGKHVRRCTSLLWWLVGLNHRAYTSTMRILFG